jgi:DNA polymerase-1
VKLLIDGDEFLFKACAAMEQEIRWDDQNHVLYANEEMCWDNLLGMIRRIEERFDSKDVLLCFSQTGPDTPNFRLGIDPTYKAHRRDARKPLCYAALRERVEGAYKVQTFPHLEADDVMGILGTKPGSKTIIVSQDKDMKGLPATVWDGKDIHVIHPSQAEYFHMYQTLVGDAADGYKGCPGVGRVKAERLLNAAQDEPRHRGDDINYWSAVVAAYEKADLTEADALVQARLSRILRWTDWDREKKEPILWTP